MNDGKNPVVKCFVDSNRQDIDGNGGEQLTGGNDDYCDEEIIILWK